MRVPIAVEEGVDAFRETSPRCSKPLETWVVAATAAVAVATTTAAAAAASPPAKAADATDEDAAFDAENPMFLDATRLPVLIEVSARLLDFRPDDDDEVIGGKLLMKGLRLSRSARL